MENGQGLASSGDQLQRWQVAGTEMSPGATAGATPRTEEARDRTPDAVNNEQVCWADFNDRLDALDRSLSLVLPISPLRGQQTAAQLYEKITIITTTSRDGRCIRVPSRWQKFLFRKYEAMRSPINPNASELETRSGPENL